MRTWRVMVDGPLDGATNMARDRAIQLACERGDAPPTLRLYRWVRPTLTLGRFQPQESVNLAFCRDRGVDVVRRFTGGRGVLHHHELTYSVVARLDDGVPRGVAASYRHLCEPLVAAFRLMGVDAALVRKDAAAGKSGACYLTSTRADIGIGTAKLAGSAQVWSGDTVLQHGSFVIDRDVELEAGIFSLDTAQTRALTESTATIASITGAHPDPVDLAGHIVQAFGSLFANGHTMGSMSEGELRLEASLMEAVRIGDL